MQVRGRELINQAKVAWIKTWQTVMVFGTPPVTAITIFAAYEQNVGKINATLTFPILSLFNILRFPLVVLPKAMRATSDMLNSIERIQVGEKRGGGGERYIEAATPILLVLGPFPFIHF